MKKLIIRAVLLSVILGTFIIFGGVSTYAFAGGDGSEENPYQISTPEHLNEVRNNPYDKYFIQINDINMLSWGKWEPIEDFGSTYDGGGYEIKYLNINGNKQYVGLFGNSYGTIKNLGIADSNICYEGADYPQIFVGSITGSSAPSALIINCYNKRSNITARYTGSNNSFKSYVGGIAGQGTVKNSYNIGSVSATAFIEGYNSYTKYGGTNYVGGIVGQGALPIENCYNAGVVSGEGRFNVWDNDYEGNNYIGGIAGTANNTQNCYWSRYDEQRVNDDPIEEIENKKGVGIGIDETVSMYGGMGWSRNFADTLNNGVPEGGEGWYYIEDNWDNNGCPLLFTQIGVNADFAIKGNGDAIMVKLSPSITSNVMNLDVFCTTDGTDPKTSDYPLGGYYAKISPDTTLKVCVGIYDELNGTYVKGGRVATFTYDDFTPTVLEVTANISEDFLVTLTSNVPECEIHYTYGWEPDIFSESYIEPFEVQEGAIVKAIVVLNPYDYILDEGSIIISDIFTFDYELKSIVNYESGNYDEILDVTLLPSIPGYEVYYDLEREASVKLEDVKYNGTPIGVYNTATLTVYLKKDGERIDKPEREYIYNFPLIEVKSSLDEAIYNTVQTVELTSTIDGYSMYYTTDTTEPTVDKTKYTEPIELYEDTLIKAIAIYSDTESDIYSFEYKIFPVICVDVPEGSYDSMQTVTLTSSMDNYDIYYTTNGKDPIEFGAKYDKMIHIITDTVIKAVLFNGTSYSEIFEFEYKVAHEEGRNINVDITSYEKGENSGIVFVAFYDEEGNPLYTVPIDILKDSAQIKVMIWSDLKNLKPLIKDVEID